MKKKEGSGRDANCTVYIMAFFGGISGVKRRIFRAPLPSLAKVTQSAIFSMITKSYLIHCQDFHHLHRSLFRPLPPPFLVVL